MSDPDNLKGFSKEQLSLLNEFSTEQLIDYVRFRIHTAQRVVERPESIVDQLREEAKQLDISHYDEYPDFGEHSVFINEYSGKSVVRFAVPYSSNSHGPSAANVVVVIQLKDGRVIKLIPKDLYNDADGWVVEDFDPKEILSVSAIRN